MKKWHENLMAWLIATGFYFGLYGVNLWIPNEMYYDEVYFIKTAKQIIQLSGYTDTVQPPFGKLLIALSMLIFGDHAWSWRLIPLLSGFGCLMVLAAITKKLTGSSRIAFLTALLFGLDGVSFTQARIGMLNATMYFFMLLAVWCLMKHALGQEWMRKKAFFLSGLCFALAAATRLIGLSIAAVLFIFYWKLWRDEKNKPALLKDTLVFFVMIPFLIYESTYLIIPFIKGYDWSMIWKLQVTMVEYHLHLKQGHTYGSEWWTWPLMMRPIWYYYKLKPLNGTSMVCGILCIGNPLIFWLIPIAMVFAIMEFLKDKTWVSVFIITGFFTQWLQWAPVPRVKFFHYIYTAMPFVEIAIAIFLDRLWRKGSIGRGVVVAYLAFVVAMFFYWVPLLNGMLITEAAFRQHMWFRSWI